MKILIAILFVGLFNTAHAATFELNCKTFPATTSFKFEKVGDEMVLQTAHHNGVEYMPLHSGIITPHDLTYLKAKADVLTKMGSQNTFRFPVSKCKINGPGQMVCFDGNEVVLSGRKMEASAIYVGKVISYSFGQTFETIRVTLAVNVENFSPQLDLEMHYSPTDCQLGF